MLRFLANRNRSVRLDLCRKHLAAPVPADPPAGLLTDQQRHAAERRCSECQIGTLRFVECVSAGDLIIHRWGTPQVYQIDSSYAWSAPIQPRGKRLSRSTAPAFRVLGKPSKDPCRGQHARSDTFIQPNILR